MKLKKLANILAFGMGMGMLASPVQAVEEWRFQDDDIEWILHDSDGDGKYEPKTSGSLEEGDVFWAVFEMGYTINGVPALGPNQELTGVAAIRLDSINIIDGNSNGLYDPGTTYTFSPFDGFISTLIDLGGPDLSMYIPVGTTPAIAAFINSTTGAGGDVDLDLNTDQWPVEECTDLTTCVQQATKGNLLQIDGWGLDGDELWQSVQIVEGGNDLTTVASNNPFVQVAAYNFVLSNLYNTREPVCLQNIATGDVLLPCRPDLQNGPQDGYAQVTGNGNVLGGNESGVKDVIAGSDLDARKYVPEPATLALFGIGLLGLGGRFRRSAVA